MTKILIIRFSSIGDIVLTSPVTRVLKTQLRNVEVHYCTKSQYKEILSYSPYIDKVICLGEKLKDLIRELRAEKYDFVVDLHNNLRTRIIKLALGVKSNTFNKLNFEKWLLVNLKINILPNVHIVDRYLDTIKRLGIKNDNLGLDYYIPEKDEIEKDWFPETHRNGYVAFAIGAQHNTKKLPMGRMIELCTKIGRPIVLLGGKEDYAAGEEVVNYFEKNHSSTSNGNFKKSIYNACGKYNLNQSASILKNSQMVFSHDTGLMHMASAFKKEIYTIWGNTVPMFGMYPYKTNFTIIENNSIKCRPCSKIGYEKCPRGHFKCMTESNFNFYIS